MKRDWLMLLLIILLLIGIFLYKTKVEDQLIESKYSQKIDVNWLSNAWVWVIAGLTIVIIFLIIIIFIKPLY